MAVWYVNLFLVSRNLRPTLMMRNMISTQNMNICGGSAEPVPLTLVPLTPKAVNPYGDGQACCRIADALAGKETDRYEVN